MTRLLIVGPPGSGKGTQASRITDALGVVAISTGDIFRANVKELTPLGVEAKKYMDAGDYVPDSVTNAMVRDRLAQDDVADGFLLDGYPRTLAQVEELDDILAQGGNSLDAVILLTADETELVNRHRLGVYHQQTEDVVNAYRERGLVREVDGLGELESVTERILASLA
jgi:adenylate kinase